MAATVARIFLSWTHRDRPLVEPLVDELLPALALMRKDVEVHWWQDSHLTCGEDLTAGVVDQLDQADYGLLLLSAAYFGRPFILRHELPRFVGPTADKKALPVLLRPLPAAADLHGIERQVMFKPNGRSYAELSGVGRTRFANDLAEAIRGRVLRANAYRTL